jgi:hypothetical protein
MQNVIGLIVIMLNVVSLNAKCHYAKGRGAGNLPIRG